MNAQGRQAASSGLAVQGMDNPSRRQVRNEEDHRNQCYVLAVQGVADMGGDVAIESLGFVTLESIGMSANVVLEESSVVLGSLAASSSFSSSSRMLCNRAVWREKSESASTSKSDSSDWSSPFSSSGGLGSSERPEVC